jgi:hypothetical protein
MDPRQLQQASAALTNTTTTVADHHRHPDDVVVAQHKLATRCQTCNLQLLSVSVAHSSLLRRNDAILAHNPDKRSATQPTSAPGRDGQEQSEDDDEVTAGLADLLAVQNSMAHSTMPSIAIASSRIDRQVQQVSASLIECVKLLQEVSAKAVRVESLLTQRE